MIKTWGVFQSYEFLFFQFIIHCRLVSLHLPPPGLIVFSQTTPRSFSAGLLILNISDLFLVFIISKFVTHTHQRLSPPLKTSSVSPSQIDAMKVYLTWWCFHVTTLKEPIIFLSIISCVIQQFVSFGQNQERA